MKIIVLLIFITAHYSDSSAQDVYPDNIDELRPANLHEVCLSVFDSLNISKECTWQLGVLCDKPDILMTMLDASSKYPYSGHLYATRMDFGNFDQCMSIDYSCGEKRILGKYCAIGYAVPDITDMNNVDALYKLSLCIPDQCGPYDYLQIINKYLNILNITIEDNIEIAKFLGDFCATRETDKELSSGNLIVIILFSVWAIIMILSTVYDILLYQNKIECKNLNLISFSVFTNGRKLIHTQEYSQGRIQILDGLRSISIIWIILGHSFSTWLGYLPAMNKDDVNTYLLKRRSAYVNGAHLGVDTFFFMSGFLFAYQYLKSKPKNVFGQFKLIPLLYFHRILRILPSLLMIYLFAIWIFPTLGSGPLWHFGVTSQVENCKKHWWSYFLFVQNYFKSEDICMPPLWYISADMQMFILAPLVLIPLTFVLKKEEGIQLSIIILSILSVFCMGITIAIKLIFPDNQNTFDTHSRLVDYLVGMMMGIFMRYKKDTPFLKMLERNQLGIMNFLIWLIILSGMLIILIFYQEVDAFHKHLSKTIYFSLYKPGWCIGLCWLIYACYHGYGGFINWILTRPIFQIIAKLSYAMYVVHYLVIEHYVLSNRSRLHFSDYQGLCLFCGIFAETTISSFLWTLSFESPIVIIEKSIFGRKVTESGSNQENRLISNNGKLHDKHNMAI